MKFKTWKGEDIKGPVLFTIKLDGIRTIVKDGIAVSRAGKPLHNVPLSVEDGVYEAFLGSFEETITALRSKKRINVGKESFYSLDPVDERLVLGAVDSPNADLIQKSLDSMVEKGLEGLVLREQDGTLWKVKPKHTHDVPVIEIIPGKGKHEGKMGALMTPMGKVGTGFSDADRVKYNDPSMLNTIIEVECMGLTPGGKFRHPRFVRERFDKCITS